MRSATRQPKAGTRGVRFCGTSSLSLRCESGEGQSARGTPMAKSSPSQRKTAGRVMHEFKHGELKSGKSGKGGKVKSRKQAIAIAMHESGTSKYDSSSKKKSNVAKSKRKESKGETYQQEKEGKSHVGARGKRESSRAMGGKNATRTTRRGKSGSSGRRSRTSATHKRKTTSSRKRKAS